MSAVEKEAQLCARFANALKSIANESELVRRGRFLNATGIVQIGDGRFLMRINDGNVTECTRTIPLFQPTDFVLKGTVEAWEKLWESVPEAGWHDIFSLIKKRQMTLEGNMRLVFAHLQYLKDLVTLPRPRAAH